MANDLGITEKGKVGQFFCKHKYTNWYAKKAPYLVLSGDRHYKICVDCGKELDTRFVEHD